MMNTPKGVKIWKNKIQGLRSKATGLIFSNFERSRYVITVQQARTLGFKKFIATLGISYSSKSPDTITMIFQGTTDDRKLVILAEKVYNSTGSDVPLAPSDTAVELVSFLEQCHKDWGFAKGVYIDNADQVIITKLRRYKRLKDCLYNFWNAYKQLEIIDRINLQLGWIRQGCYLVVDICMEHLPELDRYGWDDEKDKPEDRNNHTINVNQYAWIPYRSLTGFEEAEKK